MNRPVHCIIVAYGAPGRLDRSLAALEQAIEITVVDNSSSTTVREVATYRGANYLDSGANLGFGAGVNLALRRLMSGQEQDILLLNPDAILTPSNLRSLAERMHTPRCEKVAALAPRVFGTNGRAERVAWPFPSPIRAWGEAAGLGRWLPMGDTFVIGAVLLLRWEAIREVGLFDERFFLYSEETDWQRRAHKAGWISAICSEAVAEHVGGGTSADLQRRETLFHAGQETYIRKWYGRRGWWAYRLAACLGASVRAAVLGGERRTAAARRALLYARGPRRCAAPPRGHTP